MINNELTHSGIKGQKWGIRRFQNPDGSLTEAGKRRYYKEKAKTAAQNKVKKAVKSYNAAVKKADRLQAQAEEAWAKASEAYLATGRNKVQRILNNLNNPDSMVVSFYNELYENATNLQEAANYQYLQAQQKYLDTGKTKLKRVVNNYRYGK